MKIIVERREEVELELPAYWKTPYAYYKLLKQDSMRVSRISISSANTLDKFDIENFMPISKDEFDAAYQQAVQNIRTAYFS